MLATVPLKYIPPIPVGTFFPETDRSTYEILSIAAQRVKRKCVEAGGNDYDQTGENFRVTLPGWRTAGVCAFITFIAAFNILRYDSNACKVHGTPLAFSSSTPVLTYGDLWLEAWAIWIRMKRALSPVKVLTSIETERLLKIFLQDELSKCTDTDMD